MFLQIRVIFEITKKHVEKSKSMADIYLNEIGFGRTYFPGGSVY